jgi:hypothetical protein
MKILFEAFQDIIENTILPYEIFPILFILKNSQTSLYYFHFAGLYSRYSKNLNITTTKVSKF